MIEISGPRKKDLRRCLEDWLAFRIARLPPRQPDSSCWHVWRRVEEDGSPREHRELVSVERTE